MCVCTLVGRSLRFTAAQPARPMAPRCGGSHSDCIGWRARWCRRSKPPRHHASRESCAARTDAAREPGKPRSAGDRFDIHLASQAIGQRAYTQHAAWRQCWRWLPALGHSGSAMLSRWESGSFMVARMGVRTDASFGTRDCTRFSAMVAICVGNCLDVPRTHDCEKVPGKRGEACSRGLA
jgi:hypothetical protein